ncbi:MAG: hypothetical protein WBW16_08250 [Bacteroidota bacterium]
MRTTVFSEKRVLDEALLQADTECRACGVELAPTGAGTSLFLTDGTADQMSYCAEHIGSYLSVCLECCGVYTANPGGVCLYCLEAGSN